jgi:hypothetical protein
LAQYAFIRALIAFRPAEDIRLPRREVVRELPIDAPSAISNPYVERQLQCSDLSFDACPVGF